jgi:hypothetical protein
MGFAVCSALNFKLGWHLCVGELHYIPVTGADLEQNDLNLVSLKTVINYYVDPLRMRVDLTGFGDFCCSKRLILIVGTEF